MKDRLFAVLVLIAILGGGYIISKNQTEEDKIKSYSFMMSRMK